MNDDSLANKPFANRKHDKSNFLLTLLLLDVAIVSYGLFSSQGVSEYKLTWFVGAQVLTFLLLFSVLFFKKRSATDNASTPKTPLRNLMLVIYMIGTFILFLAWVFLLEYNLGTSVVRSSGVNSNSKVIDYHLTTSNDFGILHVGRRFKTDDIGTASNLYMTVQYNGRTERIVVYKDVIHAQGAANFAKIVGEAKSGTLPVRYLPKAPYIMRTQIETTTQS